MITIKDVCAQLNNGDARLIFGDFLDEFYRSKNTDTKINMIKDEPVFDKEHSAFLAEMAAAVHKLSLDSNIPTPEWVFLKRYYLDQPTYAFNTKNSAYQDYLKRTSLKEYSSRNIFLGDNVLKRI